MYVYFFTFGEHNFYVSLYFNNFNYYYYYVYKYIYLYTFCVLLYFTNWFLLLLSIYIYIYNHCYHLVTTLVLLTMSFLKYFLVSKIFSSALNH